MVWEQRLRRLVTHMQIRYNAIHNGFWSGFNMKIEPRHDKTIKMICAPSEDSVQPGHPPSLIRFSAVRLKQNWVLSYPLSAQRRLWSDWADAGHKSHFVGFVMRWLKMLLPRVYVCGTYTFHHIFYISHRTQYEIYLAMLTISYWNGIFIYIV